MKTYVDQSVVTILLLSNMKAKRTQNKRKWNVCQLKNRIAMKNCCEGCLKINIFLKKLYGMGLFIYSWLPDIEIRIKSF